MDQIKNKVTDIVRDFASSVDEDIEMLNTNGVVLKFQTTASEETVKWICKLIEKPGRNKALTLLIFFMCSFFFFINNENYHSYRIQKYRNYKLKKLIV